MKRFTDENIRKESNGSGVYRIYNRNRKLVYIGRCNNGNIKHHLTQHFGSKRYSGAKFGNRSDNYYDINLMRGHRKIKATENRAIRRNKPRGNKYQKGRRVRTKQIGFLEALGI